MKAAAIASTVVLTLSSVEGFAGLGRRTTAMQALHMTTTIAPPKVAPAEKTKRRAGRTRRKTWYHVDDDDDEYEDMDPSDKPLEYLMDDEDLLREDEDPFHILLMGSTFDKERVTPKYVSGCLTYVLEMPETEAFECSTSAEENGMSCLGTWPREECLDLGKQLQVRDLEVRVVPFCIGGQRDWQAKDSPEYVESNRDPLAV